MTHIRLHVVVLRVRIWTTGSRSSPWLEVSKAKCMALSVEGVAMALAMVVRRAPTEAAAALVAWTAYKAMARTLHLRMVAFLLGVVGRRPAMAAVVVALVSLLVVVVPLFLLAMFR